MKIEKNSPAWYALTSSISVNSESIEIEVSKTGRGDDVIILNGRQHLVTVAAHKAQLARTAISNSKYPYPR